MISVGIDIGTYSIKIAELEATSRGYAIRRVQEFPFSLDLTKDKKIEIIDTLRTLFAQYDPASTQFIFAVPQKSVSARFLRFPFAERFKVQKALASQLEDDIPLAIEDTIFEAKIVRYVGKASDVMAMAVPKERMTEVLNLAHDCGTEPSLISAESIGLANLFERWDSPPPEMPAVEQEIPAPRNAELILDIGHTTTKMVVRADGILVGLRNVDWGAKNLADAIGKQYSLNYIQAMRELQTKGFVLLDRTQGTKDQQAFSQALEKPLQEFVAELRLKMLEMQSDLNLQWNKGLMVGGGSELKNLGAYLTQNFEIPFNRFKQFDFHPAVTFETNAHVELTTATAVGLAIEGLRRPRNPATNFIKGEFARQSHFFESLWEKWGYTAQLVGAGFLILLVYGYLRESASLYLLDQSDAVLKRQAEAVAGLKGSRASPTQVRKFLSNQERFVKNRKQAEKVVHLNSALDILNRITNMLPPKQTAQVEIKRLSIENEVAEVHGYTGSPAEREQIKKAMEKVAANGRIDAIPSRIQTPTGKTPFAFSFRIDRYGGG